MGKQYKNFVIQSSNILLENGAKIVKTVDTRYTELIKDGIQIFIPHYHRHHYIVLYGEEIFRCRKHFLPIAINDFKQFLNDRESIT